MKLFELTNILQDLCHNGHSMQEVSVADRRLFEAMGVHRVYVREVEGVSVASGKPVIILDEARK